jgi:hypothetical protein
MVSPPAIEKCLTDDREGDGPHRLQVHLDAGMIVIQTARWRKASIGTSASSRG